MNASADATSASVDRAYLPASLVLPALVLVGIGALAVTIGVPVLPLFPYTALGFVLIVIGGAHGALGVAALRHPGIGNAGPVTATLATWTVVAIATVRLNEPTRPTDQLVGASAVGLFATAAVLGVVATARLRRARANPSRPRRGRLARLGLIALALVVPPASLATAFADRPPFSPKRIAVDGVVGECGWVLLSTHGRYEFVDRTLDGVRLPGVAPGTPVTGYTYLGDHPVPDDREHPSDGYVRIDGRTYLANVPKPWTGTCEAR